MNEVVIVLVGFFAGMLIGIPTGIGIEEILRMKRKESLP